MQKTIIKNERLFEQVLLVERQNLAMNAFLESLYESDDKARGLVMAATMKSPLAINEC